MIGDYGIFLQIFGFVLLLFYISTRGMTFQDSYVPKCFADNLITKVFNKTKEIKVFKKTTNINQQFFPIGIITIIIGLILQHSEINHFFFNNFKT